MLILGSVVHVYKPVPTGLRANACFCMELVPGVAMSPRGVEMVTRDGLVDVVWDEDADLSTFETVYFVRDFQECFF